MGTGVIEETMQKESLRQTKKCAYCSKEMENDAIKCPNCHSWIPEVKNASTGWSVSLGVLILISALTAAIFVRIALVRGVFGSVSWDVRAALQNPLFIVVTVALIIALVVSIIQGNKAKRVANRYGKKISALYF